MAGGHRNAAEKPRKLKYREQGTGTRKGQEKENNLKVR